jgi:hypothetical protein
MNIRVFPALAVAFALSFSAAGAQEPAAAAPISSLGPSDGRLTQAFCSNDVTAEVKAFCPKLGWLQSYVNSHPGLSIADLLAQERTTLGYLNPSDFKAAPMVVDAVKESLAVQQAQASSAEALKTLGTMLPVSNSDLQQAAQDSGQLRNDQQFSSGAIVAGTTSLVSKAGSAALISLAVDTGALTRSVNGSTVTLTANADEIFRVVTRQQADCIMNCGNMIKAGVSQKADAAKVDDKGKPKKLDPGKYTGKGFFQRAVLDRLNLSASFDLAQSASQTTPTTGQASGATPTQVSQAAIPTGAGKLTSFTAKYEILNSFDPRSTAFRTKWAGEVAAMAPETVDLSNAVGAVYDELRKDPTFLAARSNDDYRNTLLQAAKDDPTGSALVEKWQALWNAQTASVLRDTALPALVANAVAKKQVFAQAWQKAVADTAGAELTLQYTYNKPLSQPYTHDFTGVFAHDWGDAGSLTFNGSVSIYDGTLPVNAQYGRVHFGQISGEYDNILHKSSAASIQTDYSLAGYWQYQPNPSVLNIPAGTVVPGTSIPLPNGTQEFVGTSGSLWVGQGKITIRGPHGLNLPLAASWSNKTDLLQGSKFGGQVGISYDFSSLAGLF